MNETTHLPIRPAPLREVLDADGNPRTILGDEDYDLLINWISERTDATRQQLGRDMSREETVIEASCRGESVTFGHTWDDGRTTVEPYDQREVTMKAWKLDAMRDPELLDRLMGFATPMERASWEGYRDCIARPHPLMVERNGPATGTNRGTESWLCLSCGVEYDADVPCLRVGGRTYPDEVTGDERCYSQAPEEGDGPWCAGCVSDVLREMERLTS
jgi:hypothetical protein